ncbi:glycosyltransferase family 2 protein [Streptomyces olivaceiscleroticus]|uniref:Glycosyltransferase family 2 protein n=1 Tax=Streptomyces olivaceiscleroticus TaxID=68245 RepID=A0ABN1AQ06_9ACTN
MPSIPFPAAPQGPVPAGASGAAGPATGRPPLISVVVPCFDEEAVLERTHRRLTTVLGALPDCAHEVVYVDDGSRDGTWRTLTSLSGGDPAVRLVRLTRNFGHQQAILAGLRAATGDAVITMDADLQDPPELIPELVERWRAGWSVVSARRTSRAGESRFKVVTAHVYYRLLAALADQPVALDTGDFRLLDRAVVRLLTELPEGEPYLRGSVCWAGFPEVSVGYERLPRPAGRSKYSLRKMAELSRRGLVSCSPVPARMPAVVGVAWLGGAAMTAAVRRHRLPLAAWTFGCEAVLLGLLGEYLRLVHRELRGRPPYVLLERHPPQPDEPAAPAEAAGEAVLPLPVARTRAAR